MPHYFELALKHYEITLGIHVHVHKSHEVKSTEMKTATEVNEFQVSCSLTCSIYFRYKYVLD